MIPITSVKNSQQTSPANQVSGLKSNSAEDIQNRFLKLLVTQLRNQDPSKPMNNEQLTSQMAQLSTVTGINKLNDSLSTISNKLQSSKFQESAALIGRAVFTKGNTVQLVSEINKDDKKVVQKAVLGLQIAQPVEGVKVGIYGSDGKLVRRIDLGPQAAGLLPVKWDGKTDSGKSVADGSYTFQIETLPAKSASTVTPLAFGNVDSVSRGPDGFRLNVSYLGPITLGSVAHIF